VLAQIGLFAGQPSGLTNSPLASRIAATTQIEACRDFRAISDEDNAELSRPEQVGPAG
jgi:hypothetical protein